MDTAAWLLLATFLAATLLPAPFLGRYIAAVLEGSARVLRYGQFVEGRLYRLGGIRPSTEMSWRRYAVAIVAFNLLGILGLFGLQLAQGVLPLNPQAFG